MTETKSIWMSRTVWGAAIAVLAALAGLLGVSIDEADQGILTDAMMQLMGAAGGVLAIWGRVRATSKIG